MLPAPWWLALALSAAAASAQPQPQPQPGDAAASAPAGSELDRLVIGGWQAFDAKRYEQARGSFARAAQLAPSRADVQVGLGEALFWLGDPSGALVHFERAARLDPRFAPAHSGVGHASLHLALRSWQTPRTGLALLARAQAAFARALAIDPNYQPARDGQRLVAQLGRPKGSPLTLLEVPIAVLLLSLIAAAWLRLRASGAPRLREYAWPLGLFAGTRALLFAAFAAAPALLAEAPWHPQQVLHAPDRFVLDVVAGRWDANLYAGAAVHGYLIPPPGAASQWATVGQFPLLPVLFRWSALALDDATLAALILPNAALLLACFALFDLFRAEHGTRLATFAVGALLVHPASLHGSVLYAESLALLGMAGLAGNLARGAPGTAALWGVFAGLARINTLAIVPWLLLDFWWRPAAAGSGRPHSLRSLLACVSPLLGLALFMLYLQLELGNAFAYFDEMRDRRLGGGPMFGTLVEARDLIAHMIGLSDAPVRGGPLPMLLLGLVCLAIYAAAAIALARERRFGPALFVASGIVLALGSTLAAQPRYLWLLFAAAPWLGRTCDRPVWRWLAPIASLGALVAAAVAYARWYFVP